MSFEFLCTLLTMPAAKDSWLPAVLLPSSTSTGTSPIQGFFPLVSNLGSLSSALRLSSSCSCVDQKWRYAQQSLTAVTICGMACDAAWFVCVFHYGNAGWMLWLPQTAIVRSAGSKDYCDNVTFQFLSVLTSRKSPLRWSFSFLSGLLLSKLPSITSPRKVLLISWRPCREISTKATFSADVRCSQNKDANRIRWAAREWDNMTNRDSNDYALENIKCPAWLLQI